MEWLVGIATALGGALAGVLGSWWFSRHQGRDDAFDGAVERVLLSIAEFVSASDEHEEALRAARVRGEKGASGVVQPSALSVGIALEILEMRAPKKRRWEAREFSASWEGIKHSRLERNVRSGAGLLASAVKEWRLGRSWSDIEAGLAGIIRIVEQREPPRSPRDSIA